MGKEIFLVYVDIAFNPNFELAVFTSKRKALKLFNQKVDIYSSLHEIRSEEINNENKKEVHFLSGNQGVTVFFQKTEIGIDNQLW